MHTPAHLLADEYDALSFVRKCRRDRDRRNQKSAQEALRAARSDLPFEALGEDMPEVMSRLEEQS